MTTLELLIIVLVGIPLLLSTLFILLAILVPKPKAKEISDYTKIRVSSGHDY